MAVRKVSMNHPHFPPEQEFGISGVGVLTNDGTPVEVDEDDYKAITGMSLEDSFSGSAVIDVEGLKKKNFDEKEPENSTASTPAFLLNNDDNEGGES